MKSARVASSRQLPKDPVMQAKLRLDYHVHHVVRHERIITRSWAHQQMREPRALRFHCIPSLTGAAKHEYHFVLPVLEGLHQTIIDRFHGRSSAATLLCAWTPRLS